MSFVGFPHSLITFLVLIACLAVTVVPSPLNVEDSSTTSQGALSLLTSSSLSSRDLEDESVLNSTTLTTMSAPSDVINHVAAKETSLANVNKDHEHTKPVKQKKKKPMGKHKKKKQSFKDKLLPLLLIPFVIQTMLIPFFIMNLKMIALKAMAVGKFAILLIVFNMMRNWSKNAHSTSIQGTGDSIMAQNYGFNGGPEFGALFSGR